MSDQDDLERMREALRPFAEVAEYILAEAPADATMWHAFVDCEGNVAQISLEYLREAIRALSRDASRDEERRQG